LININNNIEAKIEEHKNKIKELKNEEIKQRELLKEI